MDVREEWDEEGRDGKKGNDEEREGQGRRRRGKRGERKKGVRQEKKKGLK